MRTGGVGGQGERECGRGGGRAGECAVMCLEDFIFFFFFCLPNLLDGSRFPSSRLQFETHADFVSAGVKVLAVDQGREGDLHACGRTETELVLSVQCQMSSL